MSGIHERGLDIGPSRPAFVIAEAGVNHNGDLGRALRLVDAAKDAGADAVKFQTFRTESIITRAAPKARYHIETTGPDSAQTWFDLLRSQELTHEMHRAIIDRCRARGIVFLSTPYDEESVDLLETLDVPLFKIASTDANNLPFLAYVARKRRPVVYSTAMCEIAEIEAGVATLRENGASAIVVMQCTGSYPAPATEANLRAMHQIGERCVTAVGYSDHTTGTATAIAAVALGACTIEKHFTLDRNLPGPDHRASLEPAALAEFVRAIRETEAALGDGVKRVMPCETENRMKLRKHVTASRAIPAGTRIVREALAIKRTGGHGLPPTRLSEIIGRRTRVALEADEPVTEDALG